MDKVNSIIPILQTFSTIAVSLTAIVALLSAIFKPVRQFVVWSYKKIVGSKDKNETIIKKIDQVETVLSEKIDNVETTLSKRIQEVSNRNDENERDRIRWEILDFANSCRNGRKHSKEEFSHVLDLKVKYERLLEQSGERNGVFEEDFKYIEGLYFERLDKNDFLA